MENNKPVRCIDPFIKFCQDCKYGFVKYPDYVEIYEDTLGCTFESGCVYGFENTVPTPDEEQEFLESLKKNEVM